ncbi:hypothetical protein JW964_24890 [candidate division KSB1 bacterium]|nr:hypothetical protein [candidate division KSB1 bacterium]
MVNLQNAWQKIGYDCHIHLRQHVNPPHKPTPHQLKPILDEAKRRGIIPHIREHAPLPQVLSIGPNEDFLFCMRHDEIESFLKLFQIEGVPFGLEVDYVAGYENQIYDNVQIFLNKAKEIGVKITSLAGSPHLLPGKLQEFDWDKKGLDLVIWEFSDATFLEYIKQRGAKQILDDYFDGIEGIIQMGIFQVINHLDVIRKMDYRTSQSPSPYFKDLEAYYLSRCRRIIDLAGDKNMVLEINTGGINHKWGQPFIQQEILNYCAEVGVGIQVGSDAHRPGEIGQYFDVAYQMLLQAGIEEIVVFEELKPVRRSIV